MRHVETREPTNSVDNGHQRVTRHHTHHPLPHRGGMFEVDCSNIAALSNSGGGGLNVVVDNAALVSNKVLDKNNVRFDRKYTDTNAYGKHAHNRPIPNAKTVVAKSTNAYGNYDNKSKGIMSAYHVNGSIGRGNEPRVSASITTIDTLDPQYRPLPVLSKLPGVFDNGMSSTVSNTQKLTCGPRQRQVMDTSQDGSITESIQTTSIQANVQPVVTPKSFVQRGTLARLYVVSMFTGVAVLGGVGGADSHEQVFVSFALFFGVFVPVVVLHGTMVVHRVWALVPMVLYVVYTPVGVALSIIYKTHAFISVSLILVGVFFLMAGVYGMGRILSAGGLSLFIWLCFGFGVDTPDRGDIVALVVIPGLQIIYVCIAGIVCVMSLPECGSVYDMGRLRDNIRDMC